MVHNKYIADAIYKQLTTLEHFFGGFTADRLLFEKIN
jgi:hypothetical protein